MVFICGKQLYNWLIHFMFGTNTTHKVTMFCTPFLGQTFKITRIVPFFGHVRCWPLPAKGWHSNNITRLSNPYYKKLRGLVPLVPSRNISINVIYWLVKRHFDWSLIAKHYGSVSSFSVRFLYGFPYRAQRQKDCPVEHRTSIKYFELCGDW